ncbi:MAG: NADH-quinone oxidoreductase subunit L [Microscillaceae bacterium]|jgi:NADH-quinone oxidoreductase subunit L|nr:NADH-quinone oxidoreductase subunit L [Microscillaceae bacterium]
MTFLVLFILILPLFNFFGLLFLPKSLQKFGDWLAIVGLGISFSGSIILFQYIWGKTTWQMFWLWFSFNAQSPVRVGIWLDNLSVIMLVIVCLISGLVHLFSVSYMHADKHYLRYFAYLGLFTFAMLGLVVSDNLLTLYIFWELVGLASYLLIGFWSEKKSAIRAAKKAFLINRIGDTGFLIGICLVWVYFGTWQLPDIQILISQNKPQIPIENWQMTLIGFCLFCGAIGKSAQFPLQIWLPDAMEGPTPVSALLHAATMVAAGVFLLARVFFLLNLDVLLIVAFIGTITAFMGAFAALVQKDLKKVLAFSTISQLGYMVLGMGVGAYQAALFHLLTHAFFKAGLFLSAGAVIHSLHHLGKKIDLEFDAQNMYLLGGLGQKMPFIRLSFGICGAALVGLPLFSGFLSKDAILSGAWAWASKMGEGGSYFFYIVPISAFLTVLLSALYIGRMFFLLFWGEFTLSKLYRKAENAENMLQDAPILMKIPLVILMLGSLWLGFSYTPWGSESDWLRQGLTTPVNIFLGLQTQKDLLELEHHFHFWTSIISIALIISGLLVAYLLFIRNKFDAQTLTFNSKSLYRLSHESFFLNQLYQSVLVQQGWRLAQATAHFDQKVIDTFVLVFARFWVVLGFVVAWFDRAVIDGLVNFTAAMVAWVGRVTKSFQTGGAQGFFIASIILILWIYWWVVY